MKLTSLVLLLSLGTVAMADGREEIKGQELTCGDVKVEVQDDGLALRLRNDKLGIGGVAQIHWHGEGSNAADLIYPDRPTAGFLEYNPGDDKFIINGVKCE